MTKNQIILAIREDRTMVWNDPDPIDGNDYRIINIFNVDEEQATIHYGDIDDLSEAVVPLREIGVLPKTELYALVLWPEVQDYMEEEWFKDEAMPSEDGAYFIPESRYNRHEES